MIIETFSIDHVAPFLKLAAEENWMAEPWEFDFLLSAFPQGCFTARGDNGEAMGFVTSLLHERSGWIGNLIVAEQLRGRGLGDALFRKAVAALWKADAQSIWLTASKSGTPIYEKHGFICLDKIIRWAGTGLQQHQTQFTEPEHEPSGNSLYDLDYRSWGDRRAALLTVTTLRGTLLQNEAGFIVQQPCKDSVQFGPFSAGDYGVAEKLFDTISKTVASGIKITVDAPESNGSAFRLFNGSKMQETGSNSLMYAGIKPDYRPNLLYGLATLGSCG